MELKVLERWRRAGPGIPPLIWLKLGQPSSSDYRIRHEINNEIPMHSVPKAGPVHNSVHLALTCIVSDWSPTAR